MPSSKEASREQLGVWGMPGRREWPSPPEWMLAPGHQCDWQVRKFAGLCGKGPWEVGIEDELRRAFASSMGGSRWRQTWSSGDVAWASQPIGGELPSIPGKAKLPAFAGSQKDFPEAGLQLSLRKPTQEPLGVGRGHKDQPESTLLTSRNFLWSANTLGA